MTWKINVPWSYGPFMICLGIGIFVQSNFIIAISHDNYLWWQVINSINQSPYNLVWAWVMLFVSVLFMTVGLIIMIAKDRKSGD